MDNLSAGMFVGQNNIDLIIQAIKEGNKKLIQKLEDSQREIIKCFKEDNKRVLEETKKDIQDSTSELTKCFGEGQKEIRERLQSCLKSVDNCNNLLSKHNENLTNVNSKLEERLKTYDCNLSNGMLDSVQRVGGMVCGDVDRREEIVDGEVVGCQTKVLQEDEVEDTNKMKQISENGISGDEEGVRREEEMEYNEIINSKAEEDMEESNGKEEKEAKQIYKMNTEEVEVMKVGPWECSHSQPGNKSSSDLDTESHSRTPGIADQKNVGTDKDIIETDCDLYIVPNVDRIVSNAFLVSGTTIIPRKVRNVNVIEWHSVTNVMSLIEQTLTVGVLPCARIEVFQITQNKIFDRGKYSIQEMWAQ